MDANLGSGKSALTNKGDDFAAPVKVSGAWADVPAVDKIGSKSWTDVAVYL